MGRGVKSESGLDIFELSTLCMTIMAEIVDGMGDHSL